MDSQGANNALSLFFLMSTLHLPCLFADLVVFFSDLRDFSLVRSLTCSYTNSFTSSSHTSKCNALVTVTFMIAYSTESSVATS